MIRLYLIYWILFSIERISSINILKIETLPRILHNDNINLTVDYQCSIGSKQRIQLRIFVDDSKQLSVFRRTWFCHGSSTIRTKFIPLQLHPSIAYTTEGFSWPFDTGRLSLVMFDNENQITQQIEYSIRFLPVHQRPKIHSSRWNPWKQYDHCHREPEILRIIDYPLVLTNERSTGKFVSFPSFNDPYLRWEKRNQVTQAKLSIVLWLYLEDYCNDPSSNNLCAILQHMTFDKTHLTPELFVNDQGHVIAHVFGVLPLMRTDQARTLVSIPKHDWCRLIFVVFDNTWNLTINCMKNWEKKMVATYRSAIVYSYSDNIGTFIIGGSDKAASIHGLVAQMDVYRRTILTSEHLPKKLDLAKPAYLPSILSESTQCLPYQILLRQCRDEADRLNKYLLQKKTCSALPFRLKRSKIRQCSIVQMWKQQPKDISYRIFRAFYRQTVNSTLDIGNKLFDLANTLAEKEDDPEIVCKQVLPWLEQAVCYKHPSAHSFLATFYQFGLCKLALNSTRVIELLINGALVKDRLSTLALGHRHFYGFDGVSQDFDAAYLYYRQMAETARTELYTPKPGEVIMEPIRLTNERLLNELIFERSDLFDWLKLQARRGVVTAQQRLGTLFLEGGHGVARNLEVGAEYIRLAADQRDLSGLFLYGLILLRGQGVTKNVTEAVRHLEDAAKLGHTDAKTALGHHAYHTEKNYTKAAAYWQECYNEAQNIYCAHNLGYLWTMGHHPPEYKKDHAKAWNYYIQAAYKGQIDSMITVSYYNAIADHPINQRNSRLATIWSRSVADVSTIVGLLSRRALTAFRENRWHTSLLFYLRTALAGVELGYFNAGYLCRELQLNYQSNIDCIEQLLEKSVLIRDIYLQNENYDLLILAEYYQTQKNDSNRTMEFFIRLFQNGDPRGLYELAQLEEQTNEFISNLTWKKIGIEFNEHIQTDKYQRLKRIYEHCQSLTTPRSSESYIPCSILYLKMSSIIFIKQIFTIKIMTTLLILIITVCLAILF